MGRSMATQSPGRLAGRRVAIICLVVVLVLSATAQSQNLATRAPTGFSVRVATPDWDRAPISQQEVGAQQTPLARLSAATAGAVERTILLNYNTTLSGRFEGSVWDWRAGSGVLDPDTGVVWLPTQLNTTSRVTSGPSSPTVLYNLTSNESSLDYGLVNASAIALDQQSDLLIAALPQNNSVAFLNATSGAWVGPSLAVGSDPNAVTFDTENGVVYVANSGSGNLTAIEASSRSILTPGIPVGDDPTAVSVDTLDDLLYVANSGSSNLSVVSTVSSTEVSTVPLLYAPTSLSWAPGPDRLAVGMPGASYIEVLDAANGATTSLPSTGTGVLSIATNVSGSDFYVANGSSDSLTIVNSTSSTDPVLTEGLPTSVKVSALISDPAAGLLIGWSNSTRQFSVVATDENLTVQVAPDLGVKPSDAAYDGESDQVLVLDQTSRSIDFINATTMRSVRPPLDLPGDPDSISVDNATGTAYVGLAGGVIEITPFGQVLESNLSLPGNNSDLVVVESAGLVWDLNSVIGLVALRLEGLEGSILTGLDIGQNNAQGTAFDNSTNRLYVADLVNGSIAVLNATTGEFAGAWITAVPDVGSVAYDPTDAGIYALGKAIYVISGSSGTLVAGPINLDANGTPRSISYDVSREYLYVTVSGTAPTFNGTVSVIDGSSLAASESSVTSVSVGEAPSVALPVSLPGSEAPASSEIWVANAASGTISVIASAPQVTFMAASPNPVDVASTTQILLGLIGGAGPSSVSYSGLPTSCASSNTLALSCRPNANGTYTVTASVVDSLGFTTSASTILSVNPAIHVHLHLPSKTPQLDAGGYLNGSASATGGTAPYSFSWNFGDGTTGGGTSVSHRYLEAGTYYLTVTASDHGGGISSSTTAVVVNPLPSVSIGVVPGNVTDVGIPIAFTSTVAGGTSPGTTSWQLGDGATSSAANVTHTYHKSGIYFVNVTYTDGAGVAVSSVVTVQVNPALSAQIVASPSSSDVDVGTSVTLTAALSGGTAPFTDEWNFGDGSYATGPAALHAWATPGTYTITLQVTDSAGAINSTTYQITVSAAGSGGLLHGNAIGALFLGLAAGVAIGAVLLFLASRRRGAPPSRPPAAFVPPATLAPAPPSAPPAEAPRPPNWKED